MKEVLAIVSTHVKSQAVSCMSQESFQAIWLSGILIE